MICPTEIEFVLEGLVAVTVCGVLILPTPTWPKLSTLGWSCNLGPLCSRPLKNAMPLRATRVVFGCPLSTMLSLPNSEVPLPLGAEDGVKLTETWQFEFAGTEPSQVFADIENGPLLEIDVKLSATALGLVIVTFCGAETVPTWTSPNGSELGAVVTPANMPVPDSKMVCWADTALSVTTTVPLRVFVWEGVKMTLKVQVLSAAI